MPVLRSHDISLYGGNGEDLVLRPLTDAHLPLLYRWNADPEVLYWTEGGTHERALSYPPELVDEIYHGVSQNALCFLIEVNGVPIGECWLQAMNFPRITAAYAPADVRRIDMAIGEKAYWGKGLGTQAIAMLVDYAFYGEGVDVLHCFSEDYNVRSWRLWERLGFTRVRETPLPRPQKGRFQYEYRLRKEDFVERRRVRPTDTGQREMPIGRLQPSQLYISEGKLRLVRQWFDPRDSACMDPLPVLPLEGRMVLTDGHTRAVAAYLAGWKTLPVYRETMDLDLRAYRMDLRWCVEEGVDGIAALARRVVPHARYEALWRKRCMERVL